jgi:hypothetical protein
MDEHGLPTNFGGEGMAMSAEYSTEDGEEEEEFKVTVHYWYYQCWEIRDILVRIRIRGSLPLANGSGSDPFRRGL